MAYTLCLIPVSDHTSSPSMYLSQSASLIISSMIYFFAHESISMYFERSSESSLSEDIICFSTLSIVALIYSIFLTEQYFGKSTQKCSPPAVTKLLGLSSYYFNTFYDIHQCNLHMYKTIRDYSLGGSSLNLITAYPSIISTEPASGHNGILA